MSEVPIPVRPPDYRLAAELLLDVGPRITRLIALAVESPTASPDESLTLAQARALRRLGRRPRLAGELARELQVSAATVSELIDALVRRGLVERGVAAGDRRQLPLRLTSAGERAAEAAHGRALAALESLLADLSPANSQALAESLGAVRARLDERVAAERSESGRDGGAR